MTNTNPDNQSCNSCQGTMTIMWWVTLLVAVLAVPSFGIIAALMWGSKGIGEVTIFIVACLACTYLGIRLMRNPKMSEPFKLPKQP